MKSHLKVHYFQHIAGEGFGSCYQFLKQHNAKITATEFFALPVDRSLEIEALPQVEDVDLLIIMGGEMSVNDEVNFPWLKIEKRWLRRYLSMGKPAIGLCLGGQLIANALGAAVSRSEKQELGWTGVRKVNYVPAECFELPAEFNVMQWHSETFEIPKGAIHLAENDVCRNQMYQIGKNVLGFQFHPEITPETLNLFLENEVGVNVSGV
jgi:GMP synthase-like glutamine amidotransferase